MVELYTLGIKRENGTPKRGKYIYIKKNRLNSKEIEFSRVLRTW